MPKLAAHRTLQRPVGGSTVVIVRLCIFRLHGAITWLACLCLRRLHGAMMLVRIRLHGAITWLARLCLLHRRRGNWLARLCLLHLHGGLTLARCCLLRHVFLRRREERKQRMRELQKGQLK